MKSLRLFHIALMLISLLVITSIVSAQEQEKPSKLGVVPLAQTKINPIEVVFKVPLDELEKRLPRSMRLYRAGPDETAVGQRKALDSVFGKGSQTEIYKQSGGIFSADLSRLWADPLEKVGDAKKMDKRAVQASAEDFLGRIDGLPGKQKTVHRVSFDKMERVNKEGARQSHTLGANITYRRLLNGYEGVGPGGKLKVFHDMQGSVAGYLRVWRKLTPEKRPQPVISLREATERFKKDPLGKVMLAGVRRVEVNAIRPAYLELGMAERQEYVQPVFVFDCLAYVKAGDQETKVPYVRYMQALVKPPELLWPAGKAHKIIERPKVPPKVNVGED
jgi:hypothetical protein